MNGPSILLGAVMLLSGIFGSVDHAATNLAVSQAQSYAMQNIAAIIAVVGIVLFIAGVFGKVLLLIGLILIIVAILVYAGIL